MGDLVQPEAYFDANLHVDRVTVLHGRLEPPLLHGGNSFRIKSMSQAPNHTDILWISLLIHNQP